jgi:RNA polymerase sigma-70 factor (ECF subfamily)
LKDVLGHSLEETAETMGTTVMAVKAALVRGRKKLLQPEGDEVEVAATTRADLDRYATLFNARDWDGVRALVSDDCRLDLVSKSHRRGKQVGMYFGNYEKANVALRLVRLEGQLAFAVYVAGAAKPAYFILIQFEDGRVKSIRDFRYVAYIAAEAEFGDLHSFSFGPETVEGRFVSIHQSDVGLRRPGECWQLQLAVLEAAGR